MIAYLTRAATRLYRATRFNLSVRAELRWYVTDARVVIGELWREIAGVVAGCA